MKELFGYTEDNKEIYKFTLTDKLGNKVALINYGATIQSIEIAGIDVCLGYDDVRSYEKNGGCLGATVGRCANRISNAQYTCEGKVVSLSANKGTFHQHGGLKGFNKLVWDYTEGSDFVEFSHFSEDGNEGYPGNLTAKVKFSFKDGILSIDYDAVADKTTLVNLTNHSYFNLNGCGDILKHKMKLISTKVAWSDEKGIPNGELVDVKDTPFDFLTEKSVDWAWGSSYPLFASKKGYDNNFILDTNGKFSHVATLVSPKTNIEMQVWTDQDDVVIYSGNGLSGMDGKRGEKYEPYSGICFEAQYMTNAVNLSGFRKPLFKAGEHFTQHTEYRFKAL